MSAAGFHSMSLFLLVLQALFGPRRGEDSAVINGVDVSAGDTTITKAAVSLSMEECSHILTPHCKAKDRMLCVDCVGRLHEKLVHPCTLMDITLYCYGDQQPTYGTARLGSKARKRNFVMGTHSKELPITAAYKKAVKKEKAKAFSRLEAAMRDHEWSPCHEKCCHIVFADNEDMFEKKLPAELQGEIAADGKYGACTALSTRLMVLARINIKKVAMPGALTQDLKVACKAFYTDTSKCLNIKSTDLCEPVCKYGMVHELEDKAEMYLIKDHNACKFAALMTGLGASILEPARALCVAFDDHCEKEKVKVIVKPHKLRVGDFEQCQETCCGKESLDFMARLKHIGCDVNGFGTKSPEEYPKCINVFSFISECIIKMGQMDTHPTLSISQHQAWSKLLARSKDLCLFGIQNYISYLGMTLPSFHIAYMFPTSLCRCFRDRCETT